MEKYITTICKVYFRSLGHTRQFCLDDFYCDPQDVPQPIHYELQWEGITKKIQLPINEPVDLQNVVITNLLNYGQLVSLCLH